WAYATSGPLVLDGPVTLELWSSTGLFGTLAKGTLYAYLYDCTPGGASCARIASNTFTANPWNSSLLTWGHRTITVGSVTGTIPAGHELRLKLLYKGKDLWLTMTASYPTAMAVTLG